MSKMSKAIAVLGVVAGLGVAALPLSSYAYDVPTETTVKTTVEGAISIAVDKSTVDLGTLKLNGVATGTNAGDNELTVTVSGNSATAYSLKISAPSGNALMNSATNTSIPAIAEAAGVATLTGGTNSWGYQVNGTGNWFGVPATGSKDVVSVTDSDAGWTANADKQVYTTKLAFGATAGSSLPAGEYKATVVFTASTTDEYLKLS